MDLGNTEVQTYHRDKNDPFVAVYLILWYDNNKIKEREVISA